MAKLRSSDPQFPITLDDCIKKYGIEYVYEQFLRMEEINKNQQRLQTERKKRREQR